MTTVPTTHVLTNVTASENPWVGSWLDSLERAGARLELWSRDRLLRAPRGSWLYLQWPELSLHGGRIPASRALCAVIVKVSVARVRRMRVLLTAHNLRSHDQLHPVLERILWALLDRLVTDVHLMSSTGAEDYLNGHPALRHARQHLIPMGLYEHSFEGRLGVTASRRTLGLPTDGKILLFFGQIRAYKGIARLAKHVDQLPADWRLFVIGRCRDDALAAQLKAAAATSNGRLVVELRHVSDSELDRWIESSDAVLLPFDAVLNSSSAILALSLGKPVHLPETPTFRGLQQDVGASWVQLYDQPIELAGLRLDDDPSGTPDLSTMSWERIDVMTRKLFGATQGRTSIGRTD